VKEGKKGDTEQETVGRVDEGREEEKEEENGEGKESERR